MIPITATMAFAITTEVPAGTSAEVATEVVVAAIKTEAEGYIAAKEALRKAGCKFPTPCTINVVEGAEHLKGLV